ncbi:MAG TPA: hypothetical protein ENN79_06565 [Desulfobacteraceae bacterium]|nr:hypothetical protein [Desulfobacteraceae bacterium]
MVYGIVKQNNGFINVYSEPGEGSTVKIYLPRHFEKIEQVGEKHQGDLVTGNRETVLLVEDEPMVLKMGRILHRAKIQRTARKAWGGYSSVKGDEDIRPVK